MEDNKENEISLKEILAIIREWYYYFLSKWKLIVICGLLGAILGLTYSFVQKPVYTAKLTFAVEEEGSGGGLGGALGLASQFGFDFGGSGGGAFEGANLLELFRSRKIIQQTLLRAIRFENREMTIAEMYILNENWREKWSNKPNLKNVLFLPANRYKKQTDSIRGALNGAITGVAVANDNTFNLNPALNIKRTPSVRRQVDVQANSAILTELVKQTEIAKVTVRKETPLVQIIDQPIYPLKKEKFGKAKGIIYGGILAGIFVIIYLTIRRLISELQIE